MAVSQYKMADCLLACLLRDKRGPSTHRERERERERERVGNGNGKADL